MNRHSRKRLIREIELYLAFWSEAHTECGQEHDWHTVEGSTIVVCMRCGHIKNFAHPAVCTPEVRA